MRALRPRGNDDYVILISNDDEKSPPRHWNVDVSVSSSPKVFVLPQSGIPHESSTMVVRVLALCGFTQNATIYYKQAS